MNIQIKNIQLYETSINLNHIPRIILNQFAHVPVYLTFFLKFYLGPGLILSFGVISVSHCSFAYEGKNIKGNRYPRSFC